MKNPIPALRTLGHLEAISFLLLVGIAMPLKYMAGIPVAVKVVGWLHGLLFVLFALALLRVLLIARWSFWRAALVFVGALLPFGPFLLDSRMRAYSQEFLLRKAGRPIQQPQQP